jgi:hypothetical protein
MSHTQVTLSGELGAVSMVDNAIDDSVQSVAGFTVGGGRDGFYLSVGDFIYAIRLPGREHINIQFEHDFHIEVQPVVTE